MSHPKRMLGAMGEQCVLLAAESFLLPHKPQVLIGFFAFSVIEYFNSLYMLESNPLVVVQLIKIFFLFVFFSLCEKAGSCRIMDFSLGLQAYSADQGIHFVPLLHYLYCYGYLVFNMKSGRVIPPAVFLFGIILAQEYYRSSVCS